MPVKLEVQISFHHIELPIIIRNVYRFPNALCERSSSHIDMRIPGEGEGEAPVYYGRF